MYEINRVVFIDFHKLCISIVYADYPSIVLMDLLSNILLASNADLTKIETASVKFPSVFLLA